MGKCERWSPAATYFWGGKHLDDGVELIVGQRALEGDSDAHHAGTFLFASADASRDFGDRVATRVDERQIQELIVGKLAAHEHSSATGRKVEDLSRYKLAQSVAAAMTHRLRLVKAAPRLPAVVGPIRHSQ